MSEYQYHEFCSIYSPLTLVARKEMASLSSRARISTHGVSYTYNYGDFRGDPKALLFKHFDVYFYMSNFGDLELIFKYRLKEVEMNRLKQFSIKYVIDVEKKGDYLLLHITINDENGGGDWIEGEGVLSELLPLYDEIKQKNYQILEIVSMIHDQLTGQANAKKFSDFKLSDAQKALIENVGINR